MIRELYQNITEHSDVRQNLISLKAELKKDKNENTHNRDALLLVINGDYSVLQELLLEEDAKIRKNTALILGELAIPELLPFLWEAYQKETQLFVRSSYLDAVGEFDYRELLPKMKESLADIEKIPMTEENSKHLSEEMKTLTELILAMEGRTVHPFTGYDVPSELVLLTNRNHIHVTSMQLRRVKYKEFNAGIMLQTSSIRTILPIRTYEEMLFILSDLRSCPNEPAGAAKAIAESSLLEFMNTRHEGGGPYYFRIEQKGQSDLEKKSQFAKRLAAGIEAQSGRQLINSTKNYEFEIRLIESKEGLLNILIKLYTIPDDRFEYRKQIAASDIRPVNAALTMALAQDYLKEGAQILDPFCGVGTMLTERSRLMKTGTMYGLNVYDEAIEKARINAKAAELTINYINRDFFDFQHDYLFDEIVTNMPMVHGKKEEREIVRIYQRFFVKAKEHLAEDGIIILYSHNRDIVRKLGNIKPYHIEREFEISMREGSYVFVIRFCNPA